MTQVRYELRPLKSDRPLVEFHDKAAAKKWAEKRARDTGQNVPLRLVTVETITVEIVEHI